MPWLIAADVVLSLHLSFILFATLGAVLAMKWRWIPWLQLPAAAWGIYVEASGAICPLTYWENVFRVRAGQPSYQSDCLGHYLAATIYPEGLTRNIQYLLGAFVLVVNLAVYAWLLVRRRR